ncbi:hypothetical protein ABS71_22945 [bacterium SCN 62-11]|nr:hypothetical protein [Candidatus Eremiobacteraeota bacterium]ODT55422.1 MAG: hypothetical protein ABS71_22945 [bacterium SCN 62-11]
MKVANYGYQGQVQSFRGTPGAGESKPAEAQDSIDLGKSPQGPGEPEKPSVLKRAGKALAYGAVAGLGMGLASAVSPYLGALAGAVPAGVAGMCLAIAGVSSLCGGSRKPGGDGGVGMAVGTTLLGGAAGLAGGVALPFLASPEVAGAAIGAATMATQWLLSERR